MGYDPTGHFDWGGVVLGAVDNAYDVQKSAKVVKKSSSNLIGRLGESYAGVSSKEKTKINVFDTIKRVYLAVNGGWT